MAVFNKKLTERETEVIGLWGYPPDIDQIFCLRCCGEGKVKRVKDNLSQCITRIETQVPDKIFICDGCGIRLE